MKTNKVLIEVEVPEGFDPVLCMKITNLAGQTPFSFRVVDQPAAVQISGVSGCTVCYGRGFNMLGQPCSCGVLATRLCAATPPAAPDGYALVPLEILDRFPEINPCNYGHDDVCALNDWGVELVLAATPPAAPAAQPIATISADRMNEIANKVMGEVIASMQPNNFGLAETVGLITPQESAAQDEVFYVISPCVQEMVDRFLGWKLPKDFSPDCGISFERTVRMYVGEGKTEIQERPHDNGWWPTGTNLLTADQAKVMFEYVLAQQPRGVTSRD